MTKEQARALLRKWPGVGQLEGWIADQPWRMVRDGWVVGVEFHGCRFRLEPVETGLRITASAPQARPAVWIVSAPAGTPQAHELPKADDARAVAQGSLRHSQLPPGTSAVLV